MKKFRRLWSIAIKESRHILRDPFTLILAVGFPVLNIVFFGYAIDFNVKNIDVAVYDYDRSSSSRELQQTFEASNFFRLQAQDVNHSHEEPESVIKAERFKAAMIIPRGFGRSQGRAELAEVQWLMDGADNTSAGTALGYVATLQQRIQQQSQAQALTVPFVSRYLFNPRLESTWFIIPGLVTVILAILSVLMTALTVAREWENGSMELLLSTPVRSTEVLVGKILPYTVLGTLSVALVYLVARFVFDVPFAGSHFVFFVGCTLFLLACLAQGVLISVVAKQQQLAMQMAMVSGLLPSLLMSGFIFPVESMPLFFQILTSILPARWFMMVSRGVFLKGAGFVDLWLPFLMLIVLTFLLLKVATKKFKATLEQ